MGRARILFWLLWVNFAAGCASFPQSEALRAAGTAGLPPRAELKSVPFFEQDDFLCGPATLAMVINDAGVAASLQTLTEQVYLPGRKGSLQVEMLAAARRHGLVAYPLAPRMEDALREVAAGTPVIVLQNLSGLAALPAWHYAVLVGFNLEQDRIVLRSGREPRKEISIRELEATLQDGGYWSMLVLRPGRLPVTAREAEFTAAVAALERTGHAREARASYRAAVARWPSSLMGLIGLGNTEYKLKDLAAAEAAFRRAAQAHPDSAAALNNLAYTLLQLDRPAEAEAAARKAVALGGATQAAAQETLDEILRKRARP